MGAVSMRKKCHLKQPSTDVSSLRTGANHSLFFPTKYSFADWAKGVFSLKHEDSDPPVRAEIEKRKES
jgi:hypothetical protein